MLCASHINPIVRDHQGAIKCSYNVAPNSAHDTHKCWTHWTLVSHPGFFDWHSCRSLWAFGRAEGGHVRRAFLISFCCPGGPLTFSTKARISHSVCKSKSSRTLFRRSTNYLNVALSFPLFHACVCLEDSDSSMTISCRSYLCDKWGSLLNWSFKFMGGEMKVHCSHLKCALLVLGRAASNISS